jgi:2-polyprenyl-6-methoxyphenol hydroxylase-like FAD-dependent oxidoreductase
MNDTMIGDRAVVLGASIAGLLSARVLAEAYAQVTVVERDELLDAEAPRKGVPQGRHIHGLMARGQQVLEELFPGFTEELMAQGVPLMDQAGQARLYMSGHRLMPSESRITVLSASRPCLEKYLRARVRSLPGVSFADCCDIVGFATRADHSRVTGAQVIRRADGSTEETLKADLVVDATGRGSRAPRWLDGLGYGRPAEEKISIGVGYASGTFRLVRGTLGRDLAIINAPTRAHPRGGGLSALEGDRYIVTLMGILGDHPPTDYPGFLAFAKSLQFPDIYDALRDAEPLTAPVAYRFPASVRHRYERLPRFPDGLVVTGDAVCSFNPIYGQGMSVAALEALALRRHLTRGREPLTRKVMGDIARMVDLPWDMAAGGDLAFPGVEGSRNAKVRLGNSYLPRLRAAAAHDPKLAVAFLRVAGMLARPETLFRPDIVLGVLRRSLALAQ